MACRPGLAAEVRAATDLDQPPGRVETPRDVASFSFGARERERERESRKKVRSKGC